MLNALSDLYSLYTSFVRFEQLAFTALLNAMEVFEATIRLKSLLTPLTSSLTSLRRFLVERTLAMLTPRARPMARPRERPRIIESTSTLKHLY